MTQLIINNIDDNVTKRLRARAAEHGRSLEEEARAILDDAVGYGAKSVSLGGLGTQIARRFEDIGLTEQEAGAMEKRGEKVKPAEFD